MNSKDTVVLRTPPGLHGHARQVAAGGLLPPRCKISLASVPNSLNSATMNPTAPHRLRPHSHRTESLCEPIANQRDQTTAGESGFRRPRFNYGWLGIEGSAGTTSAPASLPFWTWPYIGRYRWGGKAIFNSNLKSAPWTCESAVGFFSAPFVRTSHEATVLFPFIRASE